MLEWYRCGDSMVDGMLLLSELTRELLMLPAADVRTISDAFREAIDLDPLQATAAELRQRCTAADLTAPDSFQQDDWDAWFDLLFVHLVQPGLGRDVPIILCDYPASQSALAQVRDCEPPVASRFELFVDGLELANGYHELLDADELRRRNMNVNRMRVRDGKNELPIESRLLDAMRAGLPSCTGVALGFDRLVMLSAGAERVQDVMCFPIDRA